MRKYVIVFICILCVISAYSQTGRNYIYLLDCTKSMIGYSGSPNIWEPTKKYLSEDLKRLDSACLWSIIPFNDKVLEVYSSNDGGDALRQWKDVIVGKCDKLVQNVTYTNICDAWERGLSLCRDDKYNYMYLLTDGIDNMPGGGVAKLAELMQNFCGTSKNTHVYYVMLTKNAKNKDIIDVAELCDNIHLVDASMGPVNPFCLLEQTEVNINALELNKPKVLGFGLTGEYQAKIESDNAYFDVLIKNNKIKNNKIELDFFKKKELEAENYKFDVVLSVDGVDILNNPIKINVTNKPEKNIDISGGINIGEATYIEPFLFFDGQLRDTLTTDLSIAYNKYAQKYGSKVEFQVVNSENNDDYDIMFNGEKCVDEKITITPNSNKLSIIFKPNAEDGERLFYLKLINSDKLDKINENQLSKYKNIDFDNDLQIVATYNVDWHWSKTLLMWFGIILLILISLWFVLLRPILVKKFKRGRVVILNPYHRNLKIHKTVKVKFTSNPNAKQSLLSCLFIGKIVYEKNPIWTEEMEIIPTMKGECKINTNGKYVVFPFASQLVIGEEYELENNITNEKIKITIN